MAASFEYDHAYLRETVAAPLTEAMAQLAVLQPDDPVEFLGNFLLKYVETELHKQEMIKYHQLHNTASQPAAMAYAPAVYAVKDNGIDTAQLEEKLRTASTFSELCSSFVEWLATALDAEEAYIGRRIADPANAGGSLIHWISSSRGSSSVTVDKFLTDTKETITFDAFKEVAPAGGDDDAPLVDAEGNPIPPAVPKFIHVENVLREPRLQFFHVPKLGAYLTRGLQFKSFLHADVFNDANPEEPVINDEWLVVSADTMGQARAFTPPEIDAFQRASSLFVQALEVLERKLYMADVERKTTNGEDALLKEFSVAFAAQVTVQEENLVLQVQSLPDEEKALKEAELREAFMTFLLVSHTPTIALASERVVPFKTVPVLVVFATALTLLGHAKLALVNAATKLPTWDKIAPLLSESELKPRLEALTMPGRGVVAQAKLQIQDVTKADADAASQIAGCLFAWIQAVLAHADQIEAQAERERVAAEEAAAAVTAAAEV
jgi:hypothetical protein